MRLNPATKNSAADPHRWVVFGTFALVALFFAMGATTRGWLSILWVMVRETSPAGIMGFISGLMNPSPFIGVAFFQTLTGAVIDQIGRINGSYPPEAFQMAFWVCTLTAGMCLVLSFFLTKPPLSRAAPETN